MPNCDKIHRVFYDAGVFIFEAVLADTSYRDYVMGWRVLRFACLWQNSSGLKHFRGGWLCPDRGSVTWRPPVQTGPRELTPPRLIAGPPLCYDDLGLKPIRVCLMCDVI
jgi:hypothetical protein